MRLSPMNRLSPRFPRFWSTLTLAVFLSAAVGTAAAQSSAPPGKGNAFRDTSMVKPPNGGEDCDL